ncbi:MAG: hypothetical protein P8Z42_08095 [Anaerolineales bacterium]
MQEKSSFDRDEIQDFVVARTTGGVGRDDILFAICEKHGLSWPQAEMLVDEILLESSREVSLRQNVVYGIIAFFTFVAGLVLAVASIYHLATQLAFYIVEPSGLTWDLVMTIFAENYPLLTGLVFSVTLIVVGAWWLWRTVGDFFLALIESDIGP